MFSMEAIAAATFLGWAVGYLYFLNRAMNEGFVSAETYEDFISTVALLHVLIWWPAVVLLEGVLELFDIDW
jgi:hypothetical protein